MAEPDFLDAKIALRRSLAYRTVESIAKDIRKDINDAIKRGETETHIFDDINPEARPHILAALIKRGYRVKTSSDYISIDWSERK